MNLIETLRQINSNISNLLQIKWININYFYLNLWSIIHLFSGFIIMFLINKKQSKYKYLILLELIILWELFEMFMRFTGITISGLFVFKAESVIDVLLDLVLGISGGFLATKIRK
mgnify:CR=1 FL=1